MDTHPVGTPYVLGEGGGEVVRVAVARMEQPGDEKHGRAEEGCDASDTGEGPAGRPFVGSGPFGREFGDDCGFFCSSYARAHHLLLILSRLLGGIFRYGISLGVQVKAAKGGCFGVMGRFSVYHSRAAVRTVEAGRSVTRG